MMYQKSSQSLLDAAIEQNLPNDSPSSSARLLEQATLSLQEGWRTSAGRLDLQRRERTSLFPWRDQFSPPLVELLLQHYAEQGTVVLDPFVGSGTTLFEAAHQGLSCYAADLNPAAVALSQTVHFVRLTPSECQHLIQEAESLLKKALQLAFIDLFSLSDLEPGIDNDSLPKKKVMLSLIKDVNNHQTSPKQIFNSDSVRFRHASSPARNAPPACRESTIRGVRLGNSRLITALAHRSISLSRDTG
jgi:hypothetical protein